LIKNFVPKEYRPLLDYISPAAFKVVDWKRVMAQFIKLSKHAFDNNFLQELAQFNLELFSSRIRLKNATLETNVQLAEGDLSNIQFADLILDIYFSQFFSEKGVLLDLRLKHFENKEGSVNFDPGMFVHVFEPKFRQGMLDIYEGYYQNNPEKMGSGMHAVGLIKSPDAPEIEETKKMLFSHFGAADQGPIEFNLEHFKNSFHELFVYLKRKNIRLTSDFIFLGIYLVTLYLALSKIGQAVDVKQAFVQAWERNRI
jgi:hypothetical protein